MSNRRKASFGILAVLTATFLTSGCSQQPAVKDGPLARLYARISDSKAHRKEVDLLNYAGLAKALGGADPGKLPELAMKLGESGLGTPITFTPLANGAAETWEETYGFPLDGFESVATTSNIFLFDGIATDALESSLRSNKAFGKELNLRTGASRNYFGWTNEDSYTPKPNIAVLDERTVLISTSKTTVESVVNAKESEKRLSSWAPGYAVANAAERAGSLFIAVAEGPHVRPPFQPEITSKAALAEAKRLFDPEQFHLPDEAMAVGIGKSNGKSALVLVYAHAHQNDAKLHAVRFKKLIENGSSIFLRQDWKDKFTNVSIVSKGKLMTAILETEHPIVGLNSIAMGDNLV
jgi:hypothetical protein